MTILLTLLGTAIIVVVARDVFQTLFHPRGSGNLSRRLMRVVWRLFRWAAHGEHARLKLAGPVTMIGIFASWTLLLMLGWALVLQPYLPEEFLLSSGLDPARQGGFLDALYLSMVTLATLGYGDITPETNWLRLVVPLEALVGFALLTAAISWVLSIYPVLSRRHSLAREVTLMREAEGKTGVSVLNLRSATAEPLLASLTSRVIAIHDDLVRLPITYYFQAIDRRSALFLAAPSLLRLAESATAPDCPPGIRLRGTMLHGALEDLAHELGRHLSDDNHDSLDAAFRAYAADHAYSVEESG
ncbi:MAG TPA: potassium channel family protein [Thermomicrobiales bacterium]|nr:potassium channel family protein [Thermomicrobiales bacterium]